MLTHQHFTMNIEQYNTIVLPVLQVKQRILSKRFTNHWTGRCIIVHPLLLPMHSEGMDLAVILLIVSIFNDFILIITYCFYPFFGGHS